jgi:hypothetical protein
MQAKKALQGKASSSASESSAQEMQPGIKKTSIKMADPDIPELTRDQLGSGVRGKYFEHFEQCSNVVVLQPEILKTFPTS